MNLHEFARRMPKAELHVHLEGSIRPETLLTLAQRNHISLPAKDEAGLREFYHFRDFAHFIQVYWMVTGCLRQPEDYQMITYQFGSNCARQNIRYAEATFTILTNQRMTGLEWEDILAGLNRGREEARSEFGVEIRWIFDIVRNAPETQAEVLEIALAARHQGCVALGLGGDEARFPPELFIDTFNKAHRASLPCIPHAGETAGPASVWTSVEKLHAVRLGHGVRSIEDPRLVDMLVENQIALEVCPTSNICLGVYPNYAAHPLRRLWEAGALITVNSDDPPMFNTDLNQEYQHLVDDFGFGVDELEQFSLNGLRASLLPAEEKADMEAEFRLEFAHLREKLK